MYYHWLYVKIINAQISLGQSFCTVCICCWRCQGNEPSNSDDPELIAPAESSKWAIPVSTFNPAQGLSTSRRATVTVSTETRRKKNLLVRLVIRLFWTKFGENLTARILRWGNQEVHYIIKPSC